ncbi:inner membrane protein [Oleiphilus messinensis]|uniref:Inner membrane protein n=1 Tax=Oleiphilus messinensis TaxID=141451 RepID=A0A1Y0IFD2_9GAMM|nr:DUF423 domain-containing protein [Oleiphilus messinensis]ARU58516.1 inner membrane protein [Oleiphilus messinensis]
MNVEARLSSLQGFCFAAGSLFALVAVVAGAVGAHLVASDSVDAGRWQTANQYHFYHSLALLLVGSLWPYLRQSSFMLWGVFVCFCAGIFGFSVTLYIRVAFPGTGFAEMVSPVTPMGGMLLMFGWLILFLAVIWRFIQQTRVAGRSEL